MKNKLLLAIMAFSVSNLASASGARDFVLANLEPLPPAKYTNLPDGPVSTVATLDVTYWVQLCARQAFDQFVVTHSVDAFGKKQMRVGVLISHAEVECAGPSVKETKVLTFQGAFNLPGEQPEIQILKSVLATR
jgi:hypothetical protein